MATPKRKMSRSNTRSRRANWKAEETPLVPVQVAGRTVRAPRRLARALERGLLDPDRLG